MLAQRMWTTAFPLTDAVGLCSASPGPELANIYLHARYYDSALGIFLSPDPAGADRNTYRYSFGDSVNFSDSSGLLADQCAGEPNPAECRRSLGIYIDAVTVTANPSPFTSQGWLAFSLWNPGSKYGGSPTPFLGGGTCTGVCGAGTATPLPVVVPPVVAPPAVPAPAPTPTPEKKKEERPGNPREDCTGGPDTVNVNFGAKVLGALSFNFSVDRFGRAYVGPTLGGGISPVASLSVFAGEVQRTSQYAVSTPQGVRIAPPVQTTFVNPASLKEIVGGFSLNTAGGFIFGTGGNISSNGVTTKEGGLTTPQLSGGVSYMFEPIGQLPLRWGSCKS